MTPRPRRASAGRPAGVAAPPPLPRRVLPDLVSRHDDDPTVLYLDAAAAHAQAFEPAEAEVLEAVNARVAARASTEEVLAFVFERTAPIIPGDRLSVAFIEDDGQRLVSYHTVARYAPLVLDRGFAADLRRSSLARVQIGRASCRERV